MVITTKFGGMMEKWIEEQIENEIYRSPQELVRDAVRRLRELSLANTKQAPTENNRSNAMNSYGDLLEDIYGSDIDVEKDWRVPVGAKGGYIVEVTLNNFPQNATIKFSAKIPGYDSTYKSTAWFFLENRDVAKLEVNRSNKHPNRWIVHQPSEKRNGNLVYLLNFTKCVENMEGYEDLDFRSLSTIRFHMLPQTALVRIRIFKGT